MIFKTILGIYLKNKITLVNGTQIKAVPFAPDAKKIKKEKGFFLLRSLNTVGSEEPTVIENYVLLSDIEYEKFAQNEKRETE